MSDRHILPQLGATPKILGRTWREWKIIAAFMAMLLIEKYIGSFIPVSPVLVILVTGYVCRWFWVKRPNDELPEYWLGGKVEMAKLFLTKRRRMAWTK